MSRETFTYKRTCPNCGAVADVEASENDYPFMRYSEHHVERLTDGFEVVERGDTSTLTKIKCVPCGVLAK